MVNGIIRYNIECSDKIWKEFKQTMSKDDVINNVILDMIQKRVEEFKKRR